MKKSFLCVFITVCISIAGSISAKSQKPNLPSGVKDSTISISIKQDTCKQAPVEYCFPKYKTNWRCYLDVYGTTASLPAQFDVHLLKFALAYKFIGFGTTAFRVYAKIPFDSTFADSHKLVALYSPIYFYYIPFASNRPAGDVTPFATYFYIGGSGWGMKGGKLFDVGIGASMYVWDFTIGYNAISADSRNPFIKPDSSSDFQDYPVSWSNLYFSITLSTGSWLSAGAKLLKKSPHKESVKKPVKSVSPDSLIKK